MKAGGRQAVNDLHVIVISSVRPEPTSAGQIILHRHLVDRPGITLEVHGSEPRRPTLSKLIRRVAGRLGKNSLRRFVEDFWVLWGGRWIDPELPASVKHPGRSVVLTVAHGDGFMAARRYAKRQQLPLVCIFHDWWPDMVAAHAPMKRLLEREFKKMARDSALAFCVCEGMRQALGSLPNAVILPPVPADLASVEVALRDPADPFKILYFGNLGDYGPMLGDVLEESLKHPEILLQVRGSNPAWSQERKAKMQANGRWLAFAPRAELDAWLASADAFLVPMVFNPALRRRMETSFPSKLIESAQFGPPLIIWGPDYCSAVRWGRQDNRAICVTDPDPVAIVSAFRKLAESTSEQSYYNGATVEVARGEFNPVSIQDQFVRALSRCCSGG